MAFLLLDLLMLALLAAATWLAYAQRLHLRAADEWAAAPSVDYAALHAQWERERQARDRDASVAQVHRWAALGCGAAVPIDGAARHAAPARTD